MKTDNLIRVCGSVVKKESIGRLKIDLLENTCVAEADSPYSNYYGNIPEKPKPNSLFLFTAHFYTLEEVLRFSQNIDSCKMKNINVASSVLDFQTHQYPAIRLKNIPDYENIQYLQKCFVNQGVEFIKRVQLTNEALVRTNKCFVLEEADNGIYFDKIEENKGYISIPKLISNDEFEKLIGEIRNNSNCRLFDAAKTGVILDSQLKDIIRIYSEKLDLALLKCIKNYLMKLIKKD